MQSIIHPISGEKGFFCSEKEKILIDAILCDYSVNHLVTTSHDVRGGVDE